MRVSANRPGLTADMKSALRLSHRTSSLDQCASKERKRGIPAMTKRESIKRTKSKDTCFHKLTCHLSAVRKQETSTETQPVVYPPRSPGCHREGIPVPVLVGVDMDRKCAAQLAAIRPVSMIPKKRDTRHPCKGTAPELHRIREAIPICPCLCNCTCRE